MRSRSKAGWRGDESLDIEASVSHDITRFVRRSSDEQQWRTAMDSFCVIMWSDGVDIIRVMTVPFPSINEFEFRFFTT